MATSTDANGNLTSFKYDGNDRVASVTDAMGRTTVYGYDALGRQASISNPAIQTAPLLQKTYTPDNVLASLIIARNNTTFDTTGFAYDGFDRLSTTTYPGGSTEVLTYDADSNVLTRKTRAGATLTFTYDTLNRLAAKTPPSPAPVVTYAYDLANRLLSASDNSPSMTSPAGSAASYSTMLAYDPLNRPVAASWSPAPTQATPTAGSTGFGFGYDATNRRIGQSATDSTWWNYPSTAASVSYTANSLNQYTAVGAVTPTYDGNGNLTSDGTYAYCYDAESRLASVLSAGTCASPTTTVATYAYDAQGRRKSKAAGGTTTVYVTDADNREVLEYSGSSGALQRWYAFALGIDQVVNETNVVAATRATLIPDIQGSIIGTLDSGTGALTKIGYRPFGENPGLTSGSYRYTARRFDAETASSVAQPSGLYYYRARHYSPTLGRFMQADPIGYGGGLNLYAYVGNDSLNNVDPTGLYTLQIGIAGGATIFGIVVPQGGFGIAIDTQGNIGSYKYVGGGLGLGVNADVGASLQVSNAKTIYDLSGAFNNASLHGGAGLGGSVDYFVGNSPNGPVSGGGVTFGASGGGSISITRTTTQVCGIQGCAGEFRELIPEFTTPAAAATPDSGSISPTQQSGSLK